MPYKELSDSTLMHMTKKEIIEQLRCAEHNYRSCEAQVAQQYENTKDWMPVKHGHLEKCTLEDGKEFVSNGFKKCSSCRGYGILINVGYGYLVAQYLTDFCPGCGAKMDETVTDCHQLDEVSE